MLLSEFKETIYKHYTDLDGLVTSDKDPQKWSTGNGLLYTGIFYTILALNDELTDDDRQKFEAAVSKCEVMPGLYNRNPLRPDLEAQDDYIGIACASYFTRSKFALDILNYGKKTGWHYDNTNPKNDALSVWHDRFFGLVAFYYMAARQPVPFFRKLGFNSNLRRMIDAPLTQVNAKILTWLMISVAKRQNVCPQACELFEDHINNKYGNIQVLFKMYFPIDHPFCLFIPTPVWQC